MKRSLSLLTVMLALVLAVSFTLGAPHLALAQKKEDPVLARVNGAEIRQSEIDAVEADVGQSLQETDPAERKNRLLDYLITVTAVSQAAAKKKLDATPEFAARAEFARKKILMEAMLIEAINNPVLEAEMKKIYDERIGTMKPEDEIKVRHILVKTVEEANDAIKKLKAGADFDKLAREISIEPAAKTTGGDLDYRVHGDLVKDFSDVAFKLEKGQISGVVKTEFGFHVIKVEDKRKRAVPTYDQVKPRLMEFVARNAQAELIKKLREEAKIENLVQKEAPPAPPAKADPKKK